MRRVWIILCSLVVLAGLIGSLSAQDTAILDDFEKDDFADRWWFYDEDSTFDCAVNASGYNSDHALKISFDTQLDQYPGCGLDVDGNLWANADGLSFYWRSSWEGLGFTVILAMQDPLQTYPDLEGYTPFEAYLHTPADTWTAVTLPWSAFTKGDWFGDSGSDTLVVSQVAELILEVSESQVGTVWFDDLALLVGDDATSQSSSMAEFDKFALWTNGTQLRGANIWQRVVVPKIDGDFLGSDHVGPPFTQEDLNRLAALGANVVNISAPGLFTETPPYVLDGAVQSNLDKLLTMVAQADMFAVISARTGPGRSDFTFYDDDIAEWGDPALVIENVWTDQDAQDGWVEMWRYTAERYQNNPIVVGYDLMVEPNAAGRLLDIWEEEDFYPQYAGTLYDWNQFYPRILDAVREVDTDTPILVGAMGWSAVWWLPVLQPVDDARTVYMVHQYEPQDQYTHQYPPVENSYPGNFDADWDGTDDVFDQAWLADYLSIIEEFKAEHNVPVAVNEFGVVRWVPGGAEFMRDQMALFEDLGMNHAFWDFSPSWPPVNMDNDDFDFLHGPDPNNHSNVETSDLIEVIRASWSQNVIRPSNVGR
jgi:hypothetical protein